VQEQVDAGVLTEEEALSHPLKNIITRSLGHDRDLVVDLLKKQYKPGDKFLLCSDGLTNMVNDPTISKVMAENDPETAVKKLIQLALEAGGHDNVTALIVEITE
jgi:protein phosphatase